MVMDLLLSKVRSREQKEEEEEMEHGGRRRTLLGSVRRTPSRDSTSKRSYASAKKMHGQNPTTCSRMREK